MAVAHRSLTSLSFGARTNSTLSAPAGLADNDILLLILGMQTTAGTVPTPTAPAGFSPVGGGDANGLVIYVDPAGGSANDEMGIYAWYKRASSESGSYTVTHASCTTFGYLGAYTGGATSGNPTDNPNASGNSGTGGGSMTATGVTTAVDGSLIVFAGLVWDSIGATTPPTGMTERLELIAAYVADEVRATAGATGNRVTTSGPAGNGWAAALITIEPAVGGAGDAVPVCWASYRRRRAA